MRKYTINKRRDYVYIAIFVLSSAIQFGVSNVIESLQNEFTNSYLINVSLTLLLPFLTIYGGLLWLWNKHLWKVSCFKKLTGFVDINGTYVGEYNSSYKKSTGKLNVVVKQNFDKIKITFSSDSNSQSCNSLTGLFFKDSENVDIDFLYYNYGDYILNSKLQPHYGFNMLNFNKGIITGDYFNKERRTTGKVKLIKQD